MEILSVLQKWWKKTVTLSSWPIRSLWVWVWPRAGQPGVARHPSACDCQASACDLRLGERELLIKPLVGHLCCFQAGNVNNAPSTPSILYTKCRILRFLPVVLSARGLVALWNSGAGTPRGGTSCTGHTPTLQCSNLVLLLGVGMVDLGKLQELGSERGPREAFF